MLGLSRTIFSAWRSKLSTNFVKAFKPLLALVN